MYNAEIDWEIEEIKIMRYLPIDRWKIKILKKEKIKEKLDKTSVKVRKIEETSRNVVSLVSKMVPQIKKNFVPKNRKIYSLLWIEKEEVEKFL